MNLTTPSLLASCQVKPNTSLQLMPLRSERKGVGSLCLVKLGCAVTGGHAPMPLLESRYQVRQLFDLVERYNLWSEDDMKP